MINKVDTVTCIYNQKTSITKNKYIYFQIYGWVEALVVGWWWLAVVGAVGC